LIENPTTTKAKRLNALSGWLIQDEQGRTIMKFTAVFMDIAGNYLTKYFITSHDTNQAWEEILSQTAEPERLLLIIPGEHTVYSQADRRGLYDGLR